MRDVAPRSEMTATPAALPTTGAAEPSGVLTSELRPADETRRRGRALHQELAVRAGVSLLMLVFNELFTVAPAAHAVIRVTTLLGFLVNVPYYVAARTGRRPRLQVWIRMSMDVGFITAGIFAAGGVPAPAELRRFPGVALVPGLPVFPPALPPLPPPRARPVPAGGGG